MSDRWRGCGFSRNKGTRQAGEAGGGGRGVQPDKADMNQGQCSIPKRDQKKDLIIWPSRKFLCYYKAGQALFGFL